jgi:hypothetical protein
MRSAFFVVAASIFGDSILAASPADHINDTHYPAYSVNTEAGTFRVKVDIVVKEGCDNDAGVGKADFAITVTFPDTTAVEQICNDEEYLFENGSMVFAPFDGEPSCTMDFVDGMNRQFASMGVTGNVVKAPIELKFNAGSNFLIFDAVAAASVRIPAVAMVPRVRLL